MNPLIQNNFRGKKINKRHSVFALILVVILSFFISTEANARNPEKNKYFNKAARYLISHQYDKAIANYLKGINYADEKEIVKIWDDLGYAFLQKREIEKALDYLEKARSVHPKNFNVHLYLAIAHFLNEEISLASQELEKIEKNICFDESWLKTISESELRRIDGKSILKYVVERLKKEKGIYVHKMTRGNTLVPLVAIQIDAFDERNEGAFYFVQGIVYKSRHESEKAEKKLLAALDAGYDEKEVRFQLTDLYLMTKQLGKAEEQLDMLKKLGKENAEILFLNRYLDYQKGLEKEVIDLMSQPPHEIEFNIYHRLRDHAKDLLQPLHERFLQELERGKIDKSIKTLEKAMDINEQSFVINHNLALLYFDMGKHEGAEIYCARALWFKENHLGSHDLMGNIYFQQGDYGRALKEFKRMLEIDERNANAYYNLGSVYYALEDLLEAEKHWKEAIEIEKKKVKTRRYTRAIEKRLKHYLTIRKKTISFLAHHSLGKLYFEQDLIEKAIGEFERAIKIEPNEADPYLDLAKAYHKKKEIKKTTFYLEKYLYLGGKKEEEVRKLLNAVKRTSNGHIIE